MAIRQELVDSAVTFLSDPSVANAPLEKRIAFLQSKNLTQEEIDASLAQAGGSASAGGNNYAYTPSQQVARQPQPQQYGGGYGPYPGGYWQQPPPAVPRRDWRDWFIMATVVSGLSYGVYTLAKRYVVPLIAPPTPEQLTQDKQSIDASFSRAFGLIDQLTADTAAIKSSEDSRTSKLDTALDELQSAISEARASTTRRDEDGRKLNEEVRALQALVPKAIKAQEDATDARLKELGAELRSLKTLLANRMSGQGVPQAGVARGPAPSSPSTSAVYGQNAAPSGVNGTSADGAQPAVGDATPQAERSNISSSFNRFGRTGGIPEWQRAAAATSPSSSSSKKETDEADAAAAANSIVSS